MSDEMQTIRDNLIYCIDLLRKIRHGQKLLPISGSVIKKLESSLTALDSLPVAPSEDAMKLAKEIESQSHRWHDDHFYKEIAALKAQRDKLLELLKWSDEKLGPEINPSNYNHEDVRELNASVVEVGLAIRAAIVNSEKEIQR